MTPTSVFFSPGLSFTICKGGKVIPAVGLIGGHDKGTGAS